MAGVSARRRGQARKRIRPASDFQQAGKGMVSLSHARTCAVVHERSSLVLFSFEGRRVVSVQGSFDTPILLVASLLWENIAFTLKLL